MSSKTALASSDVNPGLECWAVGSRHIFFFTKFCQTKFWKDYATEEELMVFKVGTISSLM